MAKTGTHRHDARFAELDVVRTRATLEIDGRLVPSGSIGAVVLVHRDGLAYEVEFTRPVAAVVTLETADIEAA